MVILSTERFDLRPLEQADRQALHAIFGDERAMEHYTRTMTPDEVGMLIASHQVRQAETGRSLWAVVERASGEVVADCGLLDQQVEGYLQPQVEIAYHVRPSSWRQGIASECAIAVRDHAFGALGLERVISLIRPENEPSRGVARKVGMQVEREVQYAGFLHEVWSVSRDG